MDKDEGAGTEQLNKEFSWIFRDVMEVRNIFAKRQLERLSRNFLLGYIQET